MAYGYGTTCCVSVTVCSTIPNLRTLVLKADHDRCGAWWWQVPGTALQSPLLQESDLGDSALPHSRLNSPQVQAGCRMNYGLRRPPCINPLRISADLTWNLKLFTHGAVVARDGCPDRVAEQHTGQPAKFRVFHVKAPEPARDKCVRAE